MVTILQGEIVKVGKKTETPFIVVEMDGEIFLYVPEKAERPMEVKVEGHNVLIMERPEKPVKKNPPKRKDTRAAEVKTLARKVYEAWDSWADGDDVGRQEASESFALVGGVSTSSVGNIRNGHFQFITDKMKDALVNWNIPLPPKDSVLWTDPRKG